MNEKIKALGFELVGVNLNAKSPTRKIMTLLFI